MSQCFSNDRPVTSSIRPSPRAYIPPAILNELHHLDLSGRFTLDDTEVVGVGSYGDVIKSKCKIGDRGEIAVVVKRLRFYLKEEIETIFQKEIYVWSRLNHHNVLALLGFAFDKPYGFPLLMSEWMANGSSWNYVKSNSGCDLIHLITGVAAGLTYLHDQNVIHSDIKPDNIVVTDTGDARICDFGGSRIAAASKSMAKPSSGIRGTLRYLSFELVAFPDQNPQHTKESDVWAFGMTVYALIAQEHPFALYGETHVQKAIMDREVPSFNFWTPRSSEEKTVFRNICRLCWNHDPKCRAVISFIASSLQDSRQHRSGPRPLEADSDSSEQGDKNVQHNDKAVLYRPLVKFSSNLETLCELTSSQAEAYQYLHSAINVSSSVYDVFVKDFKVDGKLDHLIHAMADVMALITARSTAMNKESGGRAIMRLLQQIVECFLFINKYSRKSFEDRKLGTGDGRKMSEFISFFVIFKEALESETGVLPDITSSRVAHAIDESVLRQRLNPTETDTKGQQQCLLGTRVEVQKHIIEWALSASSSNILWLHGVAGSGKSTVIASVAEHFRGIYRLGAFLRFTRGASSPSSVISTTAFKLALFDSTIGSFILSETNRDKDIVNASLATQFEKLLLDPLVNAANAQKGPVIVILDALDECGTPVTRKSLMQVFLRGIGRLPFSFKFVITSRREQDIDRAFNSFQPGSVTILELDYTSHLSRRDVQSYLIHEISNIIEDEDIPLDGSLERQLTIIGNAASGLFVFASTIVNLVSEHDSPLEKLAEIASNVRSIDGLDQLYSTVLRNSGISWHDNTSKTRFQRVIGLILFSKIPLTEDAIDGILGPSVGKCRSTLSRLRSVIDYKLGEPIRLFHTSFSDYLMTSSHSDDWFIDVTVQKPFLVTRCFEIMKEEMRFNICDLKSSFIYNVELDVIEDRIKRGISPHVSYACSYWAYHLCEASYRSELMQALSFFMYNRLLYWLEGMSFLKKVSTVGPALLTAIKWIGNNDVEVATFVRDAWRLVNIFALPISQSVPHIYLSMLPLTATESKVSAHYSLHTSRLVRVVRRGVKRQSPLLKLLEGHTDEVNSVSFSPDGSLIASGSKDGTVRIWDMERGEPATGLSEIKTKHGYFVSFSPDGKCIIAGGRSGATMFDVESGRIMVGPFGDRPSTFVAVSPFGSHIISASSNTVSMWDLESGMIVGEPFVGHTKEVRCVACSRDGCFLVSGSRDTSVRVWHLESRKLVRKPFLGHTSEIYSVDFSPDGKYVVSASDDRTIRIWDVEKGEVDYSPLTEHRSAVISVAYSSDGTRIVSGSSDNTVMVWNSANGKFVSGPFIHSDSVTSIAFSPDATRVVSGSLDRTLRIWDAESGKLDTGSEFARSIETVKFSSDGSCIISNDGITWRVGDGEVVSEGNNNSKRHISSLEITSGMKTGFKGTFKWDSFTGAAILYHGNLGSPYCIAVSSNGKRFAFGSSEGSIRVWDKECDMLVCGPFDGQGGSIYSLTFSPDDRHLASGSDNVRVWDVETGKLSFGPLPELTGYPVYTVVYSPDGKRIASGSYDKMVRVWDLETGRSEVFEGHTEGVQSISFSPDGSRVVSSCGNSEIRVWSISAPKLHAPAYQDQLPVSGDVDLTTWTLCRDGWIRGAHSELLLWVPPNLRSTLITPLRVEILNVEFTTALDFSGSAYGEYWDKCFHLLG